MAETVPQSEPISADQVANNAGGFVFKVDDFTLLRRYIILGSDGEFAALTVGWSGGVQRRRCIP